jgi:peroxiredoxin
MMSTVAVGQKAPHFELTGTDGKKYGLEEALARGPVLVAFFKVGCPTCEYTFPFVERLHQQFRAQGVQIWGISQDDARDSRRFAKEYGVTFPVLIDDYPYKTSRAYSLEYVPTLLLIGPDGPVKLASDGFAKADLLEIQKSLAKHFSITPPALFHASDRVPEFKPG